MRWYTLAARFGAAAGLIFSAAGRADAASEAEYRQMVGDMERIVPQSTGPVTRDKLLAVQAVLVKLGAALPPVPAATSVSETVLVPESRVVTEMMQVPVVQGLRRKTESVAVQRQVTVMVPRTQSRVVASAQGAPPYPSSQSAPGGYGSGPPGTVPTPGAPRETPEMTTIRANQMALFDTIDFLLNPVRPGDLDDPKFGNASFRHIAIQTYALVISAQRLTSPIPATVTGPTETQPGSVLGLPKP